MSYQPNVQLQQVNSTTYVDTLGLFVGLDRLPGETADLYVKRLQAAVLLNRSHTYQGAFNEVNLQLGFTPTSYISISLPESTILTASIAGVVIGTHPSIPILTFDNDGMWAWRMLSEVVVDINKIVPATLLVTDGPAFQLAKQTNVMWSFAESVKGIQNQLKYSGIVTGTELFSNPVPSYTLTKAGLLTFTSEPPLGTTITYNYVVTPYDLVGSQVSLFGLKDPDLLSVANTSTGALAYQLAEFLQVAMLNDRSYWAK